MIRKDTYSPTFTEALFTIVKTWKQPRCPSGGEWIKLTWRLLFSRSVVSNSLRPHGLQHARLLRPPLSPRVCSDSCRMCIQSLGAALVAQRVQCPPAMRETWVRSLGGEDPLEKGNGNPLQHSCLENPLDGETVRGVTKSRTRLKRLSSSMHGFSHDPFIHLQKQEHRFFPSMSLDASQPQSLPMSPPVTSVLPPPSGT